MSLRQLNISESKRLDSWKGIAAFFGRDERTVKRWEKNRSLPIHRIPGNQRGGVFAYTDELTDWLNSTPAIQESSEIPPENVAAVTPGFAEPVFLAERASPSTPPAWPSPIAQLGPSMPIMSVGILLLVILSFVAIRAFHATKSPGASALGAARPLAAPDQRAVDLYLKGRYYWNRRNGESLNRAADAFTQAIAIDPSYAEAYAGLADTYNLLREYTDMPESEAYPKALAAATKAVALDDSLAEAHRALAFDKFYWKWEVPEAQEEYKKAIRLDPNDAEAHHWYATSFLSLGRDKEALAEIERARALSPTSPSILADRALILYHSGDREAGIAALKEMEQAEPGFLSPPRYLSELYFEEGDFADYLKEVQRIAGLSQDPRDGALAGAANQAWRSGGDLKMLEVMASIQQREFDEGRASGFQLAGTLLRLGRKKDATHYLQAAFTAHDASVFAVSRGGFTEQLKGDPDFDRLRERVVSYTGRRLGQPFPG